MSKPWLDVITDVAVAEQEYVKAKEAERAARLAMSHAEIAAHAAEKKLVELRGEMYEAANQQARQISGVDVAQYQPMVGASLSVAAQASAQSQQSLSAPSGYEMQKMRHGLDQINAMAAQNPNGGWSDLFKLVSGRISSGLSHATQSACSPFRQSRPSTMVSCGQPPEGLTSP